MFDAIEFTLDDGTTVAVAPPSRAGSGAAGVDPHSSTGRPSGRERIRYRSPFAMNRQDLGCWRLTRSRVWKLYRARVGHHSW
jgi:hypothetical protein